MAKVSYLRKYKVTSSDCFFFDNNIWMFLFAPIADYNISKQRAYSKFLREIQSAGATIFISSLILSEYINRCLRISYGQWKERNHNTKNDYCYIVKSFGIRIFKIKTYNKSNNNK